MLTVLVGALVGGVLLLLIAFAYFRFLGGLVVADQETAGAPGATFGRLPRNLGPYVGIAAPIGLGLLARVIFSGNLAAVGPLSLSYFVLAPGALGFLTALLAPPARRASWAYTLCAPWAPCTICMAIAGAVMGEAWFCVLLAIPLVLLSASAGGLAGRFVWTLTRGSRPPTLMVMLVAVGLPYVASPVESRIPMEEWTPRVHSQIEIAATSDIVWQQITNLDEIAPTAQRLALFHIMGLPRPIEAHMACEQLGCVRRGRWEDGLAFDGTITQIEPGKSYWVSLRADTQAVTPSLVPLSSVGGRAFGMVDDGYEIEDVGGGRSNLHLYSTYRITSGINPYATLWLSFLIQDIQHYILDVEKTRSEAQMSAGMRAAG